MSVQRSWSGSPFEQKAGYCRAVRVGNHVWVAATAPFNDDGTVAAVGDMRRQTERSLEIIAEALKELGADVANVVATRMFVTDISRVTELSEAHRAMFADNPPAASLFEVAKLVHPDLLIEIEAEAVVPDD